MFLASSLFTEREKNVRKKYLQILNSLSDICMLSYKQPVKKKGCVCRFSLVRAQQEIYSLRKIHTQEIAQEIQ